MYDWRKGEKIQWKERLQEEKKKEREEKKMRAKNRVCEGELKTKKIIVLKIEREMCDWRKGEKNPEERKTQGRKEEREGREKNES